MLRRIGMALCMGWLLAGCATGPGLPLGVTRGQEAACEARAIKDSVGIQPESSRRATRLRLQDECMAALVFENRDESRRLLGFPPLQPGTGATPEERAAMGGLAEGCGAPAEHLAHWTSSLPPDRFRAAWEHGLRAAPRASPGACALAITAAAYAAAGR
ncbi:hypothetical protein [Falsiroseomonas oryzae]|uniref:hypothetical protein n=1 Tax=Falsiroseomonas oryzae TaxID=2766473 RepID=UPI0022EA2068|nr:hypothetical protein [Roseomonas sp. MO-31]